MMFTSMIATKHHFEQKESVTNLIAMNKNNDMGDTMTG